MQMKIYNAEARLASNLQADQYDGVISLKVEAYLFDQKLQMRRRERD